MEPTFIKTIAGASLEGTENEVARVLLHQTKLFRLKNQLRSPLLRLPKEIIVQILSYIMEFGKFPLAWQPIFGTCHYIHRIMHTTTELWWKVDLESAKEAHIAFSRSKGGPQVIIADLISWNPGARMVLDYWREKRVLLGHRLRRLDLCGYPFDIARFNWMFERPLPRLNHLKIHFTSSLTKPDREEGLRLPISLQLPTDVPLQVLDLRNTALPWSSSIFTGLSELRIDFRDCDTTVEISEDELLGILGASSQLEYLSLMKVGSRIAIRGDVRQSTHERIVQLPRLASLELENSPEVVGYILAHIGLPVITSLQIHSLVPSWNLARSLDLLIPDGHIRGQLFSDPPIFEIETTNDSLFGLTIVSVGSFKIWFDFDLNDASRETIMTHIRPLVPPSTTILRVRFSEPEFDEREWKEFLNSHPELRSIECERYTWKPVFDPLWDALSPSEGDEVVLCPRLESISLANKPSAHLHSCLLSRNDAGFELKYLEVRLADAGLAEELGLLAERFEVYGSDDDLLQEVLAHERGEDRSLIANDETISRGWSE